jgi:hypothetical protein
VLDRGLREIFGLKTEGVAGMNKTVQWGAALFELVKVNVGGE